MVHFAWTANISSSCGGNDSFSLSSEEETLVSLSFLHLVFLLFFISLHDLLRLIQFNRVLSRPRVFIRHYSDRGAVYRSRASRRYFLWLEFHTSRTSSPGHHHPRRFFNYCVLERCCLPAARYFFLLLCASHRNEVFRYKCLDALFTYSFDVLFLFIFMIIYYIF